MATTPTTNYAFGKPAVGGDSGAWGAELNTALDAIDTQIKATDTIAQAALPKAGGTMTGTLNAKVATLGYTAKGSISGAQSLDVSVAQYFSLTVGGALTLSITNAPSSGVAMGIVLEITNGGAFAITWPASVKWGSGTQPTWTVAGVDMVAFVTRDGGTTWRQVGIKQDVR